MELNIHNINAEVKKILDKRGNPAFGQRSLSDLVGCADCKDLKMLLLQVEIALEKALLEIIKELPEGKLLDELVFSPLGGNLLIGLLAIEIARQKDIIK